MALTDRQFEALKEQLEKKKAKLGDEQYNTFLQKAAGNTPSAKAEAVDDDGFMADLGQGAVKSIGDIGLGIGKLGRGIQRGLSKGADAILGTKGFGLSKNSGFDEGTEANQQIDTLLKRDTAGEKIGGFVGDVASFAVPGGAAVKATKGANFLTRAGALGASDAAVTTVREGQFDRSAVDAAIIGAAFPIAGKGVSAAKNAVLPSGKDAGGRVINSLIKPLLKDFSYGKNPGQAVAEAGITANSLDELGQKIILARQSVGDEIAQKVASSPATFSATNALNPIDEAIAEAQKSPRTNSAIITRLQNLKDDLLRADADGVATRNLDSLSASELFELKREIGDLTRWTGNATDDEIVNKALKRTYGGLKGKLDENVEGIRELNEKYANLKSAEIATEYRDKIAARQNLLSFSGTQLGTAAAVATALSSGGAVVPILVGAGAGVGTEALKSPAVKTRAAAWLASASKAERDEAFKQAPWLRGALQAALFDETEESE